MNADRHRGHPGRWVWSILLAALAVRAVVPLAAGLSATAFHSPDTSSYLIPAHYLLDEGRFASDDGPEIRRTPGYPLFLTVALRFARPETVAVFIQVLMGLASVYCLYRIALLTVGCQRAALIAMTLLAFDPLHIIYSYKILSETLFCGLFLAALWAFLAWLDKPVLIRLAWAGALLTAATFVRPISYYLALLLPPLVLLLGCRRQQSLKMVLMSCAVTGLMIAPLLAWQVRNRAVASYPGFSAIQETNLYFYNAAAVWAACEGVPFYQKQQELGFNQPAQFAARHPHYAHLPSGTIYSHLKTDALAIIRAHPALYARIHLNGVIRTLLDPDLVEFLRMTGAYPESGGLLGELADQGIVPVVMGLLRDRPVFFWCNAAAGLLLAAVYLLAGYSLLTGRIRGIRAWLLLALILYFLLLSGGPAALGRFRHPIMPLFILLAGAAFAPPRKPAQ